MTTLLFCFALWLGYLALEALRLHRWQRAIPLRIAVTGTRGKTSVVRMLASVLREDGWKVLAKSTGAEAALILPDGCERPVRRRRFPSILEQIGVVGVGARLGVDVLVVEVMSLHAENHFAEVRRILRPHLVLVTNFRVDHVEAQGRTRAEVAEVLALDVPPGARVLVPEGECEEAFARLVEEGGGSLWKVPEGGWGKGEGPKAWGGNLDLVRAAATSLGVAEEIVRRGVRAAYMDVGASGCWIYPGEGAGAAWQVVSAFAANDPESTFLVYDGILGGEGTGAREKPVGLLCLRRDRGDRSLLWAEVLGDGALDRFSRLYVQGFHAGAVARKLRRREGRKVEVEVLPKEGPQEVMRRVRDEGYRVGGAGQGGDRILFGFGNLGGLGEEMVRHWMEAGEPVPPESFGGWWAEADLPAVGGSPGQGGAHGI